MLTLDSEPSLISDMDHIAGKLWVLLQAPWDEHGREEARSVVEKASSAIEESLKYEDQYLSEGALNNASLRLKNKILRERSRLIRLAVLVSKRVHDISAVRH